MPIWQEFMTHALEGRPGRDWPRPAGVEFVTIDMKSGRRSSGGPGSRAQPFKVGTGPSADGEVPGGSVDPSLFMGVP